MKFAVIGLGSMGKRRIRCLKSLGHSQIVGIDPRKDRRDEVKANFSIGTYDSLENSLVDHPDVSHLIVSTPPDFHTRYLRDALERKLPAFIEASVLKDDLEALAHAAHKQGICFVPSATLSFHPAIKTIKSLLNQQALGKLSFLSYHSGQFLPDWHPWESVSDFYVSKRETGAAREIVPFELTWLVDILGFPKSVCGLHRKTIEIDGAPDIDDTYSFLLDYADWQAMITVDVVSRAATRRLTINGSEKQLRWDWDYQEIAIFNPASEKWESIPLELPEAESGYNKNISEGMYIEEVQNFINNTQKQGSRGNTLEKDIKILDLLLAIEKSSEHRAFVEV